MQVKRIVFDSQVDFTTLKIQPLFFASTIFFRSSRWSWAYILYVGVCILEVFVVPQGPIFHISFSTLFWFEFLTWVFLTSFNQCLFNYIPHLRERQYLVFCCWVFVRLLHMCVYFVLLHYSKHLHICFLDFLFVLMFICKSQISFFFQTIALFA